MTTGTIEFDQKAASALEKAYLTPSVVDQRRIVLDAVDPRPGESVLDVGPGPGLLLEALARRVGASGRAVGVDLSESMLAHARRRCADLAWVELDRADAASLPYPPASFDAIVSTQVYEYVADLEGAFAKLFEITRPGGRVAILDTDYDAFVLFTEDEARHDRVMEAWDAHFVHRGLPRVLGPKLREAGFAVRSTQAIPIVDTVWSEEAFSFHLVPMMAGFAGREGVAAREDAQAWLEEQRRLGAEGRYFFSLNRYLVVADKPSDG
jgi:ubiquinone/menaquinone biosynthesis C-methylase UbiE